MQIQFDPRDRDACASVLAIIAALQPANAVNDADAAEAFGDTPDPATAFPPVPNDVTVSHVEPAGNATPAVAPSPSPAAAAAAAPASPPNGVETDKSGLPWDARIHSGPADKKPKNSDGTWRRKRGTSDETVAQVEAELRQIMGAGNAPAAPTPPAAPPVAASPEPAPAPVPTAAPPAPPPTPAAVGTEPGPVAATPAPSAPAAVANDEPLTMPGLMRKITALQSAGLLTIAGTNEIAVSLGLTGVRDLVHRPDMVASFAALLPEPAATA